MMQFVSKIKRLLAGLMLWGMCLHAHAVPLIESLQALAKRLDEKNIAYGLAVSSVATGNVVFEKNSNADLNPASTVKLFTVAAALDVLKPEYRFKTEYYATGPIENGVLTGNLVIKGYGDPTIVTERLEIVAAELKLLGIRKITGALVADESYFDGNNVPAGYSEDEAPDRAYAAPIGALSFNHNSIAIYVRPTEDGKPAFVTWDPHVDVVSLSGVVYTNNKSADVGIATAEKAGKTSIQVSGHVGQSDPPKRYYRRILDPAFYFLSALQLFLAEKGIETSGVVKKGPVPPGSILLMTDYSRDLSFIVKDVNNFSNNFMSEMLVKVMGGEQAVPATFDNGLKVIRQFAEDKVGLKKGSFVLGNGSGLNKANRLSAMQLVKLLLYMHANFDLSPEFKGSLCVAGLTGTVQKRLKNSTAKGRIRAKTGTLPNAGVSNLAGYALSGTQGELAFAFMMSKKGYSHDGFWVFEKQLADILAGVDIDFNEGGYEWR